MNKTSWEWTHKYLITEQSKSSQHWARPWAGPWPQWLTWRTHFISELSSFPFYGQGNWGTERHLEFKLRKSASRAVFSTTTLYSNPTLPASTCTFCCHHTSPNLLWFSPFLSHERWETGLGGWVCTMDRTELLVFLTFFKKNSDLGLWPTRGGSDSVETETQKQTEWRPLDEL